MVYPTGRRVRQLLTELTRLLPESPATTLFGMYPKELKPYAHAQICMLMFMAAIFIIAKMGSH